MTPLVAFFNSVSEADLSLLEGNADVAVAVMYVHKESAGFTNDEYRRKKPSKADYRKNPRNFRPPNPQKISYGRTSLGCRSTRIDMKVSGMGMEVPVGCVISELRGLGWSST